MRKHSSGPWEKVRDATHPGNIRISSPGRPHIAKVYAEGAQRDEIAEANADVMIASPLMLEVLQLLQGQNFQLEDGNPFSEEIKRRALVAIRTAGY